MNTDVFTGPLTHSFALLLALLNCSLNPHCWFHSDSFARAIYCAQSFAHSYTLELVGKWMVIWLFLRVFFFGLDHSKSAFLHSFFLYLVSRRPESGLDLNYCRNPSKHSQAWCYVMENGKEKWKNCNMHPCALTATTTMTPGNASDIDWNKASLYYQM